MNLFMSMPDFKRGGSEMLNETMLRKIAVEVMGAKTEEEIAASVKSLIRLFIG